ncbi:MAG: hypothetical protein AAF530_00065 [Pseudomonadota bacterium]
MTSDSQRATYGSERESCAALELDALPGYKVSQTFRSKVDGQTTLIYEKDPRLDA